MSRSVFNANNTGHVTKNYPMFFGESLGLSDTVNTTNKAIRELVEKQRAFNWAPTEISMSQDKMDMLTMSKDIVDLLTLTIGWQSTQDSVAGRSIGAMLLPHVTNPECEALISEWSRMEVVHGESYQHIIKQTMVNPDQALQDIYDNLNTLKRSEKMISVFNSLYNMPHDTPLEEKKRIMAKVMATILAMEYIAFQSSFAVTFAIAETGKFAGIGETVRLVCRDEVLHSSMSYEIIKAQKEVDGWGYVYDDVKQEITDTLCEIVQGELDWADYLFSEGRSVVGLTAELLKGCTQYHAGVVFKMLGLDYPFEHFPANPCTYMERWVDGSAIQHASQETQHGSYRQGSVVDDMSDDLDLDFSF